MGELKVSPSFFGNHKLLFRMALDGLLRGDPKTQAETWALYRQWGAVSADEWREDMDRNPIADGSGKYHIVPSGTTRLDKLGEEPTNDPHDQAAQKAKDNVAAILAEMSHEPKAQVQGFAPKPTIATIASDAVDRIHKVTLTQIQRWKEQDPSAVEGKMPEFWDKQQARLVDALSVCDRLTGSSISGIIADAYVSQFRPLDYHEIFGATENKIDVKTLVEERL